MFLLVSIVLCFLGAPFYGAEAASCHLREMDLCLATALLAASDGIPTTDEDMDRLCEPIQEGIDCFGNYSAACFTPLLQEMYDLLSAEPKKYQQLMCTHGTDERARALEYAPCLSEALSADNIRSQMDDFMVALDTTTKAEFHTRIPMMCCGIQRFAADIMKKVEEKCGKEVLEQGGMMMGMSFSTISTTFCGGYKHDSQICSETLPPKGTPNRGSESNLQIIQFINTALSNLQ